MQASGLRRLQLEYFLLASLIGSLGGITNYLINYGIKIFPLYPFGNCTIILYALITVYAIIRYRLLDANIVITRTTVFMIVYAAVLGLPLWGALSWQTNLQQLLGQRWWVWVLVFYAALTTVAHYVNLYFQRRAETRLLAEQQRYQAVLRQASQGMTLVKEIDRLLKLIVHLLTQKVRIRHAAIYLWDKKAERFIIRSSRQWKIAEPPTFLTNDPLMQYVQFHRSALVTEELQLASRGGSAELGPVVNSLKSIDAAVFIPSFVEDHCLGFLVLGEKISGALFTQDDLSVFQVLANQAALAIENAQFYEELKRTQADLFQTAKMASLGHMAGGMSHQINNRFHVLTILAGTLKAGLKDLDPASIDPTKLRELWGKALETLGKIEDNSLCGGEIVKTLLRFSRPSREYQPITVSQILTNAREVAQYRVNFTLLDFIQDTPDTLPSINGNLNQLADCFFNLLSNSFDAIQKKDELLQAKEITPAPREPMPFKGRIRIRAWTEEEKEKRWVVVELQDNGVGIAKEDLESLFIPFFTTKATAEKGTGLGLYIIQRILEQHGGSILASSTYGLGTTFTMRLPAMEGQ